MSDTEPLEDLHVAVVTPDLGVGGFEVAGCGEGRGEGRA